MSKRRYTKMHVHKLVTLIGEYDANRVRAKCTKLLEHIGRHRLHAHFPMWFKCSEMSKLHDLHDLYYRTFGLPAFTIDEYKMLTNILLNKGCTLPCIHTIYMYMFNPDANVASDTITMTLT